MGAKKKTPRELCENRVQRGIEWLNTHAPNKWVKNLFVVRDTDKGLRFVADETSQNQCVLALAFRGSTNPKFRGWMDHVTFRDVRKAFGLSRDNCNALGFCTSKSLKMAEQDAYLEEVWQNSLEPLFMAQCLTDQNEQGQKSPAILEGENGLY